VLTGYGARDFRDLVGSGRLAEAIGRPRPERTCPSHHSVRREQPDLLASTSGK
jgi:hypothetical protein